MAGAITEVWTDIMSWITTSLADIQVVFYTAGTGDDPGSLTFLGVLAVIGTAIAVCFLLVGVIQNFLRLRS